MDIQIWDRNFQFLENIEAPKSLIWNRSYYEPGSFEIYVLATPGLADVLREGNYVRNCQNDEMMCVIERVEFEEEEDGTAYIAASGRDMVKVLCQRCLDGGAPYNGYDDDTPINDVLQAWLWRCMLNPADKARYIPEVSFVHNPEVTAKITVSGGWGNLWDAVQEVLKEYEIGIRCVPDWENGRFSLELYNGANRTSGQHVRDAVVFSDTLQTLETASYYRDRTDYANVAYVAGESLDSDDDDGTGKRRSSVVGEASGLDRYELYVDARDLQRDKNKALSVYTNKLQKRGREKLAEKTAVSEADGDSTGSRYQYRVDYDVGDKVSMSTRWGIGATTRITAVQEVWDENGYTITPTYSEFAIIVEGGAEVAINAALLYEGTLSKGQTATVSNISAYSILLFYVEGKLTPIQVLRANLDTTYPELTDNVLRGDAIYVPESGNMYQLAVSCEMVSGDTIKNVNSGQIKIGSNGDVSNFEKLAITRIVGVV